MENEQELEGSLREQHRSWISVPAVVNRDLVLDAIEAAVAALTKKCGSVEVIIRSEPALFEQRIAGDDVASRFVKAVRQLHFDLWPTLYVVISVPQDEERELVALKEEYSL